MLALLGSPEAAAKAGGSDAFMLPHLVGRWGLLLFHPSPAVPWVSWRLQVTQRDIYCEEHVLRN